jgi:hypothetical protein
MTTTYGVIASPRVGVGTPPKDRLREAISMSRCLDAKRQVRITRSFIQSDNTLIKFNAFEQAIRRIMVPKIE